MNLLMNLSLSSSISWNSGSQKLCCQRPPSSFYWLQTPWFWFHFSGLPSHVLTAGLAPLWAEGMTMTSLFDLVLRTPKLSLLPCRPPLFDGRKIKVICSIICGLLLYLESTICRRCDTAQDRRILRTVQLETSLWSQSLIYPFEW